jgi:hypothetical protein
MLSEISARAQRRARLQQAHPLREEGVGQGVGGGEAQGRGLLAAGLARFAAQLDDPADQLVGAGAELLAGGRQGYAVGGAVEQRRADPVLQRADATAERGLGDVPVLRGAREVSRLGQGHEIFEPDQFHG